MDNLNEWDRVTKEIQDLCITNNLKALPSLVSVSDAGLLVAQTDSKLARLIEESGASNKELLSVELSRYLYRQLYDTRLSNLAAGHGNRRFSIILEFFIILLERECLANRIDQLSIDDVMYTIWEALNNRLDNYSITYLYENKSCAVSSRNDLLSLIFVVYVYEELQIAFQDLLAQILVGCRHAEESALDHCGLPPWFIKEVSWYKSECLPIVLDPPANKKSLMWVIEHLRRPTNGGFNDFGTFYSTHSETFKDAVLSPIALIGDDGNGLNIKRYKQLRQKYFSSGGTVSLDIDGEFLAGITKLVWESGCIDRNRLIDLESVQFRDASLKHLPPAIVAIYKRLLLAKMEVLKDRYHRL